MINNAVVVTRHKALVEYLLEANIIDAGNHTVIEHATLDDIIGRDVIGVLPFHMAVMCRSLTVADLVIPNELRGKELSLDDIQRYVVDITTYVVTKKEGVL